MPYIFKGRLCGLICSECPEPLANVKIRLYRSEAQEDVTARAVANAKETFAILDDQAISAKKSRLLAEAETDADGNFSFQLNARTKYQGGPFEIDVVCDTVPRLKPGKNPPPPDQIQCNHGTTALASVRE